MGSLMVENPQWTASLQLQRVLTNRSPVESPPVAKKLFRTSCIKSQQTCSDSDHVENRSILKRVDCIRSKTWHAGQSPRKVNFHQNVLVAVYDRVDGDSVSWQSQQLNTEPRDRRAFIGRMLASRLQSMPSSPPQSAVDEPVTAAQSLKRQQSTRSPTEAIGPGRPLPAVLQDEPASTSIKFSFQEDGSGQLWLRFTVALGPGVAAGDALVKANVAGNKVRVLGTRTVNCETAPPARQDFAQRYTLPMDVEPYAISARMDSGGNLFVEAPVVTGDRGKLTANPPRR